MRFIDIFKSNECREIQDIFEGINRFSSAFLKKYNDQIEALGFNAKPKEIFDNVWGTVEFSAVEISLIDSPLIQRLRNIKQLGFAHFVYCNADYNRFAHTLGVVEIAGRMSRAVTRNLKQPVLDGKIDMTEAVRLAAIFHDCGHMFYSHVSEKFFAGNKNYAHNGAITAALTFFNEKISMRAAFHEMLSIMVVNSREVFRFFTLTSKYLKGSKAVDSEDIELLIDYISGLIVGTAVDKHILPYSMIIKGTIDADRIDFLSRDSCTTKVPLAVDVNRLIKKLTVVKISNYQPSQVWNDHTSDDYPYQSMAIQYTAQKLIGQFSMARTILYQSIYYHHKKITAEAMFGRVCENILEFLEERNYDFEYLMSLTDQAISENFLEFMVPRKFHNDRKYIETRDILIRIRERNLYKRVASFSQDVVESTENYIYEGFVTNIIENQFSSQHTEFMELMRDEYYSVLSHKGMSIPAHAPTFMFVEANWISEMAAELPVDFGNGSYKMSSQIHNETPSFGEENRQKQYYLVTDQNERALVYVAFEHLLYSNYNIRIQESASTCAKFTSEQLTRVKLDLFSKDYYQETLTLLPDRIVRQLYNPATFQAVLTKYQSFMGARNSKVTEQSLFEFLRQFLLVRCNQEEIKYLLNGILFLLEKGTFIDRNFFAQSVSSLMRQILGKNYKNNFMVKIGGAFDSANRLSYYFNDIKEKNSFRFIDSIADTLKLANDSESCVVFFDDGAYSGKQVVSIFQELMGVPLAERETNEQHTAELDEESKKLIQSANLILAYICFNKDAEQTILEKLQKLGICNVKIIYEQDISEKIFSESKSIFSSQSQKEIVERLLRDIGCQVQRSSKLTQTGELKDRWDENRIQQSALGYNDAQQMVIFDFNVPTYTLTPFWQNGLFNGKTWRGLFQRTDK